MPELTPELDQLRGEQHDAPEVEAKEPALEHLHRRLATVAGQTATDDFGNAA